MANEIPEAIAAALRRVLARSREPRPLPLKVLREMGRSTHSVFPSETEILEELRPHIERELILARIAAAEYFATFPLPRSRESYLLRLRAELEKADSEIAKRSAAR